MRSLRPLLFACAATAAACSDPVPTAGDPRFLYVANPDHDSITRVDLSSRGATSFAAPGEPARIARRGSRVYVTLRGRRTVSVFEETGSTLEGVGHLSTSAEPVGIAVSEDRIYVACQTADRVEEFDAESFEPLRSFSVPNQPRGLALHPSGRTLVVTTTFGGKVAVIDLADGAVAVHALPALQGFSRFSPNGETLALAPRITADPVFRGDGAELAIGGVYVDHQTPIQDPNDPAPDVPVGPGGGGYDQGRITPVAVLIAVDPEGGPAVESGVPVGLVGAGRTAALDDASFISIAGYPSALRYADDWPLLFAAIEGSDAVLAMDLASPVFPAAAEKAAIALPPGAVGVFSRPLTGAATRAAPVGLELRGERLYIHSNFDRSLESIELASVRSELSGPPAAIDTAIALPSNFAPSLRAELVVTLAPLALSNERDRGRRLFYAGTDPKVASVGGGISCATCHFEGRTDGLTWTFTRGPRQTPSLAGDLTKTHPVGWQGDRGSVAEDAMLTSQGLMGGVGLTEADTQAIQAFLSGTRVADRPGLGRADDQVARGRALFHRADVGCATCHAGEAYTLNGTVPMFELSQAKIRHLVGIATSPPYFHDGSAPTLMDVLLRARDGSMGNTGALSEAELQDLAAYLETL